ncbi:dynamin-like GTPase family protein [Limnoraphis robusta]|uniref:Dynamin family protein n=1 Tax=Limnoraphis robusta CS-951 TaxID=1637645 RepID=A0A0F5YLP9_9CYAN|nr:dynamin-like GTPase family protein [Limnoraphis robusta]KKD39854.1 dynamin family protein [Limnoraphis robusta CS-951]
MNQGIPQCQNLQEQVESLLGLLHSEPTLRQQDVSGVRAALNKVISPTFEIVFAGAFSAGKSMLINALLGRKLLYSAEGHATGTECYIRYAEQDQERVVLTFLSEVEIREQVKTLCELLNLPLVGNINQPETCQHLQQQAQKILEQEGGEARSERAKQAKALELLLEGFEANRDRIHTLNNATYSMEQFDAKNIEEAAQYARRSKNSAVIKRIEYYCNHYLLKDGNVIIDTPGIDAPVKKDAQIAYDKIENPDTSAVVFVPAVAKNGAMTTPETELLEKMKGKPAILNRVFYVFNYIDETWYNDELRLKLETIIRTDFRDTTRIYKTSGLLGFYSNLVQQQTYQSDRWGLDSIFAENIQSENEVKNTPQFVNEFNRYCLVSGRLPSSQFRIPPEVLIADHPNEKYTAILNTLGNSVLEHLIQDSGVEEFRDAMTGYLMDKKRHELFEVLAKDLQSVCISLRESYLKAWRELESQPREVDALKELKLKHLNIELKQIGDDFCKHIEKELNLVVASAENLAFEKDFKKLQHRMISRLDVLITSFSVGETHKRAQASHERNAVVPMMGILAEAFYYLANELEVVLEDGSKELMDNFFYQLSERVRKADFYSKLYRLLGNDNGVEQNLERWCERAKEALVNESKTECDRYIRERPEFYSEGTVSVFQLRQVLQEACRGYDYESMVQAEPAIRQLLKIDFEPKLKETILRTYRPTVNKTLIHHLLEPSRKLANHILQQHDKACEHLAKTLDKEASEQLMINEKQKVELKQKIEAYNQSVKGVNQCLETMRLDRKTLPEISEMDLLTLPVFEVSSTESLQEKPAEIYQSENGLVSTEFER